jgi:hypothetical protein
MNNPKVIIVSKVSKLVSFPKLLDVSTQITGNIKRFIMGIKSKIIHQDGLFIIFIKIIPL